MHYQRSYNALNPDEKVVADQVTAFCQEIVEILGQVITANLSPRPLTYLGDLGDPVVLAYWVIDFAPPNEEKGGVSLQVYCDWIANPNYRHDIFRQILIAYADHIYQQATAPDPE